MAVLFIITHELVTLEQIISKRNYSHLYNNGIATSELTINHDFWSQFAFLHNPPPPYDSALWDPGYSTDDSLPLLVDDSSTDGYDSSSSEESIPVHARYDVDSDIDDCSPDSMDELWNAEFWSTSDQGAYLLLPAAWASWQLANSVENGNDYDNHQDAHGHPDEAESDNDEFYGVAPSEDTSVTASSAASIICRILASGRQQLSTWNCDPAVTVIDTAALSTAPVTLANYGHTVNLATQIVSWAIHADIHRNRYASSAMRLSSLSPASRTAMSLAVLSVSACMGVT